ncbi:MAG: InlB B-repeat-containing protein [Oscillospiraceae bacterium]|nr:InlB B-repeat-containing protein [Oscillospiraceae bacterium]
MKNKICLRRAVAAFVSLILVLSFSFDTFSVPGDYETFSAIITDNGTTGLTLRLTAEITAASGVAVNYSDFIFRWQRSDTQTGVYTNVNGATSRNFTESIYVNGFYRCEIRHAETGETFYTNINQVNMLSSGGFGISHPDLEVEFRITGAWGSGGRLFVQYETRIFNTGNTAINDWAVKAIIPNETTIESFWGGANLSMDSINQELVLSNSGSIPANSSITSTFQLGFTPGELFNVSTNQNISVSFLMLNASVNIATGILTSSFTITIRNTGSTAINAWAFNIDLSEGVIFNSQSNMTVQHIPGDRVTLSNLSWNNNIAVNGSIQTGISLSYPVPLRFILDAGNIEATLDIETLGNGTTIDICTVSFDRNGGIGLMSDVFVARGNHYNIKTNTFTRANYTFNGWNTEADGSGTHYAAGETIDYVYWNTILYAQWEEVLNYTITFNPNGGEVNPTSAAAEPDGTLVILPTPTRSGFVFNGWFTAQEYGIEVTTSTVFTADTTIYAQWLQNLFIVTFNPNGGSVDPLSALTEVDGKLSSLPIPERSGAKFAGWFRTEADGGAQVTTDTVFTENVTVIAYWTHDIEYDPNGGLGTAFSVDVSSGENHIVGMNSFTAPEGYVFDGWLREMSGGSIIRYLPGSTISGITENIVLYAQWVLVPEFNFTDSSGGIIMKYILLPSDTDESGILNGNNLRVYFKLIGDTELFNIEFVYELDGILKEIKIEDIKQEVGSTDVYYFDLPGDILNALDNGADQVTITGNVLNGENKNITVRKIGLFPLH